MYDVNLEKIVEVLKKELYNIKELERVAYCSLYERGDKADYIKKMREKAYLLVMLPTAIEDYLSQLSSPLKSLMREKVGGMAFSAEKALTLDSVFYMSALLYPDNYQDGDLNDLEVLINMIQ